VKVKLNNQTDKMKVVGTNPAKLDGVEKVIGTATYAGDVYLPGMLQGKIKRSPHARAQVKAVRIEQALALKGVKAVLTYEDVPRIKHKGAPAPRAGGLVADQYILTDKPLFVGDGVAAVAAVSEEIAAQALELIQIDYEVLPAVFDPDEAMEPGAPSIHGSDRNLVMSPICIEHGDVARGLAAADQIFEATYTTGRPHPAYLEPNICVSRFDRSGKLTVWSSTQAAFMVRGSLSEVLGIPAHDIRVIVEHMGGSFGAKQDLYQHEYVCTLLARKTGCPVRMEYSRAESFIASKTRHPVRVHIKQGVKQDGTLTARQVRYLSNTGAYASHAVGITWVGCECLATLYRCQDNLKVEGMSVYTNNPVAGAFRGFGGVQAFFALDSHMDEMAAALGLDPVAFRLHNAVRDGDLGPAYGVKVSGNGLAACLKRGAAEVGWFERRAQPPPAQAHKKRGWGVGTEMHTSGAFPAINEQSNATLKMNEDGTVHLLTGIADLGTGSQTAMAQIAAEELGLPLAAIRVTTGDTEVVPFDIGAYASRTVFVGGGAVQQAARHLKAQLLTLAAEKWEAAAQDLEMGPGTIAVKGTPQKTLTFREVVQGEGTVSPRTLIGYSSHEPKVAYSFGAHFVEVEVDTRTGQIAVKQVTAVHEIGRAVYPIGVEGQIEGGIQQGLGHTLSEELVVDQQTGKTLNAGFVDYKMPLAVDMPPIKTIILEEAPDPGGPFGAKGVGEDPIMAIGPAIANAVFDAIGVRFRELPITPEMVLKGLKAKARG
jgi:xanthine dehydrogenase molybdenum-binding subunit